MSKLILGIELGSTRIKAVLIDENGAVLASGAYEWQNDYVDGHWSYSLEKVKEGLQTGYKELVKNYGKPLTRLDAIGISAMMHGYLAFDKDWKLLAPFRTWRDTTTSQAADILTEKLKFNMPQRWSATHYYQAVLNRESHVKEVAHLTTLAGYVHYLLTGKNVVGANDASGMFPLEGRGYNRECIKKYNELVDVDIKSLLPEVMFAGENAGVLTEEGAKYLDPAGNLQAGAVLCPPEGDMGTGMVCTNAISPATGQVSSGTSANLTVVLQKPLKNYYREVDIIATPDGKPVALLHTNNCTSEINEWVNLFGEVAQLFGAKADVGELFEKLFNKSAESDATTGKLSGYNFLAGEPLANTEVGAPLIVRSCEGKLNLANFMQMQIYSAIASLSLGMDILEEENVQLKRVTAHGGFYKTEFIGQNATSAVLNAPVTVMQNAGEGGPWGVALLAGYTLYGKGSLQEYLDNVFKDAKQTTVYASEEERAKCNYFLQNYKKNLQLARLASKL